jgi:hypothetical protein
MKQTYNIRIRNLNKSDEYPDDTRLVPVEGSIIEEHSILPVKLFIHHTYISDTSTSSSWTISDFTTGYSYATGETRKEALQNMYTKYEARTWSEAQFNEAIETIVKQYGKAN